MLPVDKTNKIQGKNLSKPNSNFQNTSCFLTALNIFVHNHETAHNVNTSILTY